VNPRTLILADDLTGALEAGALYAASGRISAVYVSGVLPQNACAETVVVDIETRHADPQRAHAIVARLMRAARERRFSRLYLKVDSTLRGPIGSQISGLFAAWPERSVVFVPAYPRMGRTVRDGLLYVNGVLLAETVFAHDPLEPSRSSRVADKVSEALWTSTVEVANADALRHALSPSTPRLFLCDAETDADLTSLAAVIVSSGSPCICAGSAGLLAELIKIENGVHAGTGLIVNGSLHAVSRRQCAVASSDVQIAEIGGGDSAALTHVTRAIAADGWAILSTGADIDDPEKIAACIANVAAAAVHELAIETLAIFGGDTAARILARLGVHAIYPVSELLPGIPLSRVSVAGRPLRLITKAGGFGNTDVIRQLRSALSKQE
jgi:uncharacterized protein YgbK (DUF1537 family)